jgi:hypothetical protein
MHHVLRFEGGSDSVDLPTDVCDACLDQHYSCCHACGDYTRRSGWCGQQTTSWSAGKHAHASPHNTPRRQAPRATPSPQPPEMCRRIWAHVNGISGQSRTRCLAFGAVNAFWGGPFCDFATFPSAPHTDVPPRRKPDAPHRPDFVSAPEVDWLHSLCTHICGGPSSHQLSHKRI